MLLKQEDIVGQPKDKKKVFYFPFFWTSHLFDFFFITVSSVINMSFEWTIPGQYLR